MSTAEPPPQIEIPPLRPSEEAAARGHDVGDLALKEEVAFEAGLSREQMEAQARTNEHRRGERFREHFEWMAIIGLWLSFIAIGIVSLIWLSHMVLPTKQRWLSTEDLSHIQSIVTAGLLVGLVGGHFKKRLG